MTPEKEKEIREHTKIALKMGISPCCQLNPETAEELLAEIDRLRDKCNQFEANWMQSKYEFGNNVKRVADERDQLREKLAVAREAIEAVLNSQALKEAPFYNYSEAIVLAKEALSKIGGDK
jgi:hypothetical protein